MEGLEAFDVDRCCVQLHCHLGRAKPPILNPPMTAVVVQRAVPGALLPQRANYLGGVEAMGLDHPGGKHLHETWALHSMHSPSTNRLVRPLEACTNLEFPLSDDPWWLPVRVCLFNGLALASLSLERLSALTGESSTLGQ